MLVQYLETIPSSSNFVLTFLPLSVLYPIGNNDSVFPNIILEDFSLSMLIISQLMWIRDLLLWWLYHKRRQISTKQIIPVLNRKLGCTIYSPVVEFQDLFLSLLEEAAQL